MNAVHVVIGANFGDEGKGREVDRLVSRSEVEVTVIRHNSSAQAGHTVCVGDHRHVFSHLGSGTLRGATTLLAHRFVVNPHIFAREVRELNERGVWPTVFVDENCVITTPLDSFLNQLRERARGDARHGSCGVGFGETLVRARRAPGTVVTAGTFGRFDARYVEDYVLDVLRLEPDLAAALEDGRAGKGLATAYERIRAHEFNWTRWLDDAEVFFENARVLGRDEVARRVRTDALIFEGAQGLLLHQDLPEPYHPHVTWCRTGLEDVVELLALSGARQRPIHAHYATRAYLTRHGAGPLEDELSPRAMEDLGYRIEDPTNVHNEHQGSLRFAELNVDAVWEAVDTDVGRARANGGSVASVTLAVSCCDQAPKPVVDKIVTGLQADFPLLLGWGADSAETEIIERRGTVGTPVDPEVVNPPETAATETGAETSDAATEQVETGNAAEEPAEA